MYISLDILYEEGLLKAKAESFRENTVQIDYDAVRAFDTFWKIPASCPTAIEGEWIKAPGYKVIDTLKAKIQGVNLVAEDLGDLRPEVLELKNHYHLKGMKIFVFSIETNGKYAYDSFHDVENMIIYTGTHDNDTLMEWYGKRTCAAQRKIRPMADVLGQGREGHLNTPGTVGSPNWEWRMPDFTLAEKEMKKYENLFFRQ